MRTIIGYIDGVPLYGDPEEEKRIIGNLFPNMQIEYRSVHPPKPTNNMQKISNQVALEGQFKEDSLLYTPEPGVLTADSFKNTSFKVINNNWEFLLEEIRTNGVGNKFLLDYTKYEFPPPIEIESDNIGTNIQLPLEEVHKRYISGSRTFFINKFSNFRCEINKLVNYIDANRMYFGVSYDKGIDYNLSFNYIYDGMKFKPATETMSTTDKEVADRYAGVVFRSNNLDDIYAIIDFLKGKGHAAKTRNGYVISRCYEDLLKNKRGIGDELHLLYKQMPLFVIQSIPDSERWSDLLALIQYDDAHWFKDSSNAIIRCICGFKDTKYLFDKFSSNPDLLIHIFHNLDGTFVETNEEQGVVNVQSAKMSYVSILTALCLLHLDATTKKNKTFYIGEDSHGKHFPGVNITEGGEPKQGKIYLSQSDEWAPLDNPENYYHPLDIVHLVFFDKDGKPKKPIPVPAIYVRAIAIDMRVEKITFALRLVGNVIVIMLAVITLYGVVAAPAIFMRVLSQLDVFFAGADIGMQASKKYLQQSELGRQFYEQWDKIYTYGGFATAAPLLVHAFYKLGLAAIKSLPFNSLERLAIMDEMVRATVERNTFLRNFTLEIVVEAEQAAIIAGSRFNITPINRLLSADVLFLRVKDLETISEEFFVIYKGEIIAEGTAREVCATLKKAMTVVGKTKIISALDALLPKWDFNHLPTSGFIASENMRTGTYLIGRYWDDFEFILKELGYPKITDVKQLLSDNFEFITPLGQKFNLLNVSKEVVDYFSKNKLGNFFDLVNAKWIDKAVERGEDIFMVTIKDDLYRPVYRKGKKYIELTGFGKEVHRLEWKYGYRFDEATKQMLPPTRAKGLKPLTKFEDYKIID
ncbi:MAG: hypothetical protein K1X55_16855 [Chitinophagales bacterium]|nr:hypothetical protein [Chitinophagales bacterium]